MAEYNTSYNGPSGQVCACSVDLSGPASAQTFGTGSLVVSWLPISQRVEARNDGTHLEVEAEVYYKPREESTC